MIIFMAGYPGSGKTTIIKQLQETLPEDKTPYVISPRDYKMDDYDSLSEEDKRRDNISAWELSLKHLKDATEKFIIYDTACASYPAMHWYFTYLKKKHKVMYVYVNCKLDTCKQRKKNDREELPDQAWNSYAQKFKESIKKFIELADEAHMINNSEPIESMKETKPHGYDELYTSIIKQLS